MGKPTGSKGYCYWLSTRFSRSPSFISHSRTAQDMIREGSRSMPLQENELARREGTAVLVRAQPLRVRWEMNGLSTSDGNDLRCTFTASVQAVDDALDRRMFA